MWLFDLNSFHFLSMLEFLGRFQPHLKFNLILMLFSYCQEVSDFVTMTVTMMMVITWMPFFDPCLVQTDPFIGPSLMERIFNGVAHQDTLGGLGIGDIGLKKSMNLRVKVYSQI